MGLRHFLTAETSLKIMKNALYFMLKALFVLEIFSFLSWFLGYVEKWFDKKAVVNFKIYDVSDGEQIIIIHILSNISRSKDKQTIKFGPVLQKSCRK